MIELNPNQIPNDLKKFFKPKRKFGSWILRNVIIWKKPNAMPQSVKDRFSVDFEYIFFFVKSRKYWFEQQYEPHVRLWDESNAGSFAHPVPTNKHGITGYAHTGKYPLPNPQGRNRRCVWTIPTQPYSEPHFATFPEALIEPMIRAGCPKGGIVLDPFCGSGTTVQVAESLQRETIGIDLGYENLSQKRRQWNQVEMTI
jgi:DNA modification methylase